MQSATINMRVNKRTHQKLTYLAKQSGVSMQSVLDDAVESYRRQAFLEGLNADFAALKSRPDDWADELEERKLWEQTYGDGLNS